MGSWGSVLLRDGQIIGRHQPNASRRYHVLTEEDMVASGFPQPVVDRLHQMYSYINKYGCAPGADGSEHGCFSSEHHSAYVHQSCAQQPAGCR